MLGRLTTLTAVVAIGAGGLGCGRHALSISDGGFDLRADLAEAPASQDAAAADVLAAEPAPEVPDAAIPDGVVADAPVADGVVADAPVADAVVADASVADGEAGADTARRPYRAIAIAVGRYHSCALLEDHSVKCWGDNTYGQLGLGDMKWRGKIPADMGDALPSVDLGTGRTATALAAGRYATCAILDTGDLKCWGLAQLTGLGVDGGDRGDMPGEMGDALPIVDLGPGKKAAMIAVGYFNACVVRDDGTLRCWGTSDPPADYPLDGKVTALAGASSVLALFDDGGVAMVGPRVEAPLTRLYPGRRARAIAGSEGGSCASFDDASFACVGISWPPPATTKLALVAVSETGHVVGTLPDGSLRTWSAGRTGFPWTPVDDPVGGFTLPVGQPVTALAGAGNSHSCALLADGSVKCWNWSGAGNDGDEVGGGPDPAISSWPPVDLGTLATHP